jgi:hypothetical protein
MECPGSFNVEVGPDALHLFCIMPYLADRSVRASRTTLPGFGHGVVDNVDIFQFVGIPKGSLKPVQGQVGIVHKTNLVPIVLVHLIEKALVRHDVVKY